jgi:dihydrofolate synthase/folylpolyglutamate synthase
MGEFPAFSSSAEVFTWLSRFIKLERGQTSKSFRLDRMQLMAGRAGHPEKCAPAIHIAGSKGKGSVTGMISAVLETAGISTARYMSPHVAEYRERVSRGAGFFDEPVYTRAGEELRRLTETLMDPARREFSVFHPGEAEGEAPTFFELLTVYFFLCARQGNCRAMSVETGMGGRLDPTNILDPLAAVITGIELEHAEFLGDTVAAIAGEKAGIIKPGKPLILAEQVPEAREVFRRTAAEKRAPLWYFPETAAIENLRVHEGGTDFTLSFKKPGIFPAPLDLSVGIPGAIQAKNAGLAVLALKTAFPALDGPLIRRGLEHFRLPARFERIRRDPPVIIDGAHTPNSTALCASTFLSLYGEGGILLFGCAAHKNAREMAQLLVPCFSRIIITTPGSFKQSEPEKVFAIFEEEARKAGPPGAAEKDSPVRLIKETKQAIRYALDLGRQTALPLLGTGSFYLAAEIRGEAGLT